jgi:hypothetical protein
VHEGAGERIFEVRLGDEVVFEVDIAAEAGLGKVLHKWVEFDLREDVVYLNRTHPALNAYVYLKQILKLTFQRVRGQPKLEALVLLRGDDVQSI